MSFKTFQPWKAAVLLIFLWVDTAHGICRADAFIAKRAGNVLNHIPLRLRNRLSSTEEGISIPSSNLPAGEEDAAHTEEEPVYIEHVPVMVNECMDLLLTNPDGMYMDVTLGYGGHAEEILKKLSDRGTLVGVDRDPEAVHHTKRRLHNYVDSKKLQVLLGTFSNLPLVLKSHGMPTEGYSGLIRIIADLGVSTHQLECSRRGFAYGIDGPLDMRMSNPLCDPFNASSTINPVTSIEMSNTAYKLINQGREYDIARIIQEYGEENRANLIARRIVEKRKHMGRIATTQQLRSIVLGCVNGNRKTAMKVLARVFQALRIYVNDELTELRNLLEVAPQMLDKKHGRLVVLSYHSLEDRLVKHAFADLQAVSKFVRGTPSFRIVTKKCLTATEEENRINQKARSAKIRCIERCKRKLAE